jgi:hypothetical protein
MRTHWAALSLDQDVHMEAHGYGDQVASLDLRIPIAAHPPDFHAQLAAPPDPQAVLKGGQGSLTVATDRIRMGWSGDGAGLGMLFLDGDGVLLKAPAQPSASPPAPHYQANEDGYGAGGESDDSDEESEPDPFL